MDTLFKSLQLDRQFIRQYDLLMYMYTHKGTQTTQELTCVLEISAPTLRAELSNLRYQLKDHLTIQTVKSGEFALLLSAHTSIHDILRILARQTLVYQIIHQAFYDHKHSMIHMTQILGISRTTYMRVLSHMNTVLRKFHLTLSGGELKFLGREDDIRSFLFHYYVGFGDASIISSTAEQEVKDWMLWSKTVRSCRDFRYNHFRAALWLSIVQVRHRAKSFVRMEPSLLHEVQQEKAYSAFHKVAERLLHRYYLSLQIPADEITWMYIVSLHCVTYLPGEKHYHSSSPFMQPLREDRAIRVEARNLLRTSPFPIAQTDECFLRLTSFLVNVQALSKLSRNFERCAPSFIYYMRNTYSTVFHGFYRMLLDWTMIGPTLKFDHIESVAACLTTILMTPNKTKHMVPLRVIFALQGSPGYDEYVMEMSKVILSHEIEVYYNYEHIITKEELQRLNVDLIISNFTLHLPASISIPTLRLSYLPTASDWEMLRTMTETLRISKNLHTITAS